MRAWKRQHSATIVSCRRIFPGLILCGALLSSSGSTHAAEHSFSFLVHVSFSKKAAARLAALSEGIVVSASYSGDPVPTAVNYADEVGQIDLGTEDIEAPGRPETVQVTGTKVNRDHLSWIKGPILLNVNVYSARRSGPDNILACDFFDGKLQDAVRTPVALHCSLIEEKIETKHRS